MIARCTFALALLGLLAGCASIASGYSSARDQKGCLYECLDLPAEHKP